MPRFGKESLRNLNNAHPEIQRWLKEGIKIIDFKVLDSIRGQAAQNKAFREGFSKAKFGSSAHNYSPSIAVDLFPDPYNWHNKKSFIDLYKVLGAYNSSTKEGTGLAKKLLVPIRWGGDWNMDGNFSDGWDFPHYELHPWRTWSKMPGVTLYKGK